MKLSARVPATPMCGSLNRGIGQTGPLVLMWCERMMVKSTIYGKPLYRFKNGCMTYIL
jgi:hypothetical protein